MITIQHLKEMNRRGFAKAIKKLNKVSMITLLENEGIWVKSSLKTDEILEILLDVVDGVRTSIKEDINKINAKNKRRETIRKSKERRRLEEEEKNKQRSEEEKSLKGIWDELTDYERCLIVWNAGFNKGLFEDGMIYDLTEEDVPSFVFEDKKFRSFICNLEENGLEGCRRMLFHIHPDTCKNYKTYEFTDLSKNFELFKRLFGIGETRR
ncbi:hypothetical protein GNF80_10070 [Clostridium perfringens]|nr:hypothetical protein [Clostridium perfringens]